MISCFGVCTANRIQAEKLTACSAGAPAQEKQEKQTLTLVLWDYDKTSYDRRLIEAFEQTHPGVEMQVISSPDNYYDQKMEAFLLGDKNVDIFLTRTTASLKRMCEHGVVQELDDLVEQYGLDLADSPQLEEMRYDGTLYGVPYRQDRYVLFYNCDLFDQAGVPYPQERLTWPQLYELAQKLQNGLKQDGQYALMVLPIVWSNLSQGIKQIDPRLKEMGYRVYILSNYSEFLFKKHTDGAAFWPYIDGKVVSYEIHKGKPDPAIYLHLLNTYGLKAEECLFLDDRRENIEAAKRLGIRGIQVTSRDFLNRELDRILEGGEKI